MRRSEIQQLIREHQPWYQQIHFGFLLDTKSSFRHHVRQLLGRRSQWDVLLEGLPDVAGRRVIDVGCNAGTNSLEISCRGAADVLGVEINPRMVAHANVAERIYRGLGRPVGKLRFENVDLMQRFDLLQDRDVLVACCVLYHLGDLAPLERAIEASPIDTLVIQGNTVRCDRSGPDALHQETAGVEGIVRFAERAGFRSTSVTAPHHQFPVVVARRS